MRPGGCLFFRRGGPRGRAGAVRKHAKVCVLEGAPRARAGARAPKIIVFSWICRVFPFLKKKLSDMRVKEKPGLGVGVSLHFDTAIYHS